MSFVAPVADCGKHKEPEMLRRLVCRFIGCFRCKMLSTDEGIGGQCIDCGRVHGWVARDELRAYAERVARMTRPDFIYDS